MAKTVRVRSNRPNNGQRSPNVCVSSSCLSSSSDDNDFADDKCDGSMSNSNNRMADRSWVSKKSRTSSSEAGDFISSKTTNQLADENVEGAARRPRPPRHDRVLSRRSNSASSKRKWEDDEDFNSSRKGPKCFSRNAVMARLNRMKKKHYLESLENNVSKLSEENNALKGTVKTQTETVRSLKNRVRYLESVLANSHEISMLLKNIEVTTGLPTINSLQSCSKAASLKEQSKVAPNGFPPPQLDHIYSKTPDVVMCGDTLSAEEETLIVPNTTALEEDFQTPFIANDTVTLGLPFLPSDDNLLDINILSPNSDDMFNADFSDFNQHFEDDDKLLSDVGICLHIAKKRVSLEFCATCNNNAVNAWDHAGIFV